jgi:alkanesulfonate monooxygenase SsuD/methylene tetrahydromethanopterin reductase-like flavin-dependent oxidoreductase (luciferase family)
MAALMIRFDLRLPPFATTTRADQYAAALDMCEWADEHGFLSCVLSEHHGTDDGYLPSPLVMAAAVAARTKQLNVFISAMLFPFHNPLRLAEDIAVVDNISRGRIALVAGLGYRQAEFEMFGINRKGRGKLVEETIGVLRQAWTGEPFEYQGRPAQITPKPFQQPHPMVFGGGSTEIAARRAARLHLPFMPSIADPELEAIYNAEAADVGFTGGFVMAGSGPGFVHVSDDPERAWETIGPHALFDAQTYAQWQTPGQRSSVHVDAQTIDDVRKSGVYRIVTPDECVELANELGTVLFHPLMGGMDPDLGWESLELFAAKVLPRL